MPSPSVSSSSLVRPSLLLMAGFIASLLVLLLAAPNAHAGSYVGAYIVLDIKGKPVLDASGNTTPCPYSGGSQYAATGQDDQHQPTFSDVPDIAGTSSSPNQQSYGGGSSPTQPHGTHADCSGAIQTSWKWVPASGQTMDTDPPPSQVIIMQTCTVSVTVEQPGGMGSYDDGLGQSGQVSFDPPAHLTGSATDTKYVIHAGGATVSLDAFSPVAKVSNSPANASVSYSATITPVTISVGPTTLVNGMPEALTGSPLTASLNPLPSGYTASNYSWDIESAEGGSVCSGYIAAQGVGMVIEPSTVTLQSPAITFYDGIQDTVTVNLASVTITFPDNTTGTANATAAVSIVKPMLAKPQLTNAEYDNFAQHPNDTSSQYGAMEHFSGLQITIPPGFSGGVGCIVQKIQSTSRVDMRHTGSNYTAQEEQSGGSWIAIPTPCLDTDFPYPFETTYSTGQTTGYGWLVSATGSGEDYPTVQCAPPLVSTDTGNADWYASSGNDQFMDWIMYNPSPGSSSCIWVPLNTFTWNWSNQAGLNIAANTWSVSNFQDDSGMSSFTLANDWPTWNTWAPFSGTGELAMRP